ncbi:TrlF family AAA-like ATPase [Ferrovibrio sp. MS7]|uniref:TrlF family AAA-like ATPase n=1 Tax=Ferrovibrio plantarum TaxID=3119164 RepID=UPI00313517FE
MTSGEPLNSGSRWHRWEPHIHAPGTLFNNQFKGPNAWADYLSSLEQATPVIRAIAVTDYYCTDTYQHVVREMKESRRLPQVALVFPNVELRLDVATVKERWTNIHLLVSPDDPNHVAEIDRFLSRLRFEAFGDNFACTRADLIKLGRKSKPEMSDERAAFRHGASQFKVNFAQLREEFGKSDWAQAHMLIAVAGAETDGTSGIRDTADATLRQEIEKFAHVIFASSPAQRDFWLARKAGVGEDILRERYGGCKPCLHGSDAHDQGAVAKPDGDRFSWIKGDLTFDALRQACIDPAGRAYVGVRPPFRATPARVISTVELKDADWAQTPKLALNPGLVAIIGARGSGKTALADAVAAGCDATDDRLSSASFIVRAREHLDGVGVRLSWETGDPSERNLLDGRRDPSIYPRARYLSQKFVEELCSADGIKDDLLTEIERVIFEAHTTLERDGATDFKELLNLRTTVLRDNRARDEEAIATLSDEIGIEREKQTQIAGLKSQITQKEVLLAGYMKSRDALVTAGSADRVARLNALTEAADHVRNQIRLWSLESQALRSLQNDVSDFRTNRAPMALRTARQSFAGAHLEDKEWEVFRQTYSGNVDGTLTERLAKAERAAAGWRGTEQPRKASDQEPYVAADATLNQLSLGVLEAEIGRIQRLINIDTDTANRLRTITAKIGDENAALKRLRDSLADCEGAEERTKQLAADREQAYLRVFESIVGEEQVLHELYRPLMDRLAKASGTLRKLSFSVSRHADIHRWATEGEGLFDKRRTGPFKGVGTLEGWAESLLRPAWESGDPAAVAAAMAEFRQAHQTELLELSEVPRSQQSDYRSWLRRFAKWLYGTSHIEISYSIDYEAVDIRKLSPGTRGIVLLLLYLALDDADDRPLIIDQPEENLDPKSIFDELVELFIAAKNTRQVIMVTHNANLVVNTDADQVIVAFAGTHTPGKLPPIRYLSGGLESAEMRKHVCDILEGGERAFKERARRLRVRLER